MSEKNFFGQNPLFKRAFSMVFVLFLVLGALAFMGCPMDDDDSGFVDDHKLNAVLEGTWKDTSAGDVYEIATGTVIYKSDYSGEEKGDIEYISNFSADSGVIIIKYNTPKDNGRTYGAVYYRELKTDGETSVKISIAGKYESTEPWADITPVITTLEKAKEEFTEANGDGNYVTYWGGPYVKQ
jgi:hypothetical protein